MTIARGVTLGPYEVLTHIGAGGMGDVWRARDKRIGRDVAVKVFDPDLASVVGLKRFQNEIAIAGALHHPSIVPLYDSGGGGDCIYYTMPLIRGDSLRARLERELARGHNFFVKPIAMKSTHHARMCELAITNRRFAAPSAHESLRLLTQPPKYRPKRKFGRTRKSKD